MKFNKIFTGVIIVIMFVFALVFVSRMSSIQGPETKEQHIEEQINQRFIPLQSIHKYGTYFVHVIKDTNTGIVYLIVPGGQILKVDEK